MIHVCFSLYDKTGRYSKFTGTTMLSLFANTNAAVTVHILHDDTLTAENRDRLTAVATQFKQTVKFYNVEATCAERLAEIVELVPAIKTARVSVATFYRFLIPYIFPHDFDRIIYLDSDVIVNMDIDELWQIDLGDKPLAAVPEIEADSYAYKGWAASRKYLINAKLVAFEDYFNAGVLLINLDYLRRAEDVIRRGINFYVAHPQCDNFDQDILNYLFAERYIKLPARFDHFVTDKRFLGETECGEIYHYVLESLQMNINDPFNRLWWQYFARTPWFDAEIIGRMDEGIRRLYNDLRGALIGLTATMSGKTRAFVVRKGDVESVKKLFAIRDDEELIVADKYTPLQEVFESLNASRSKKIFFILIPDFPFVNFEKLGFVHGKDFINGFEFLPELWGLPFSSHRILAAM